MKLTELQSEALKEILNMGAGRAAASLESLTGEHFILNVPSVSLITVDELEEHPLQGENNRAIMLHVEGDLKGFTSIAFSIRSAELLLANLLKLENSDGEAEVLATSALMELGNMVVGAIVGVFANILKLNLRFSAPTFLQGHIRDLAKTGAIGLNPWILIAQITFVDSKGKSEGYFMTVFDVASMDVVIPSLDSYLREQGLL